MMIFSLQIELGNDAMRSTHDIAKELLNVAHSLAFVDDANDDATPDNGRIYDANGNRVGHWAIGDPTL